MMQPDLQRLAHILDYCVEIEKTVQRFGKDFDIPVLKKFCQEQLEQK